MVSLARPGALQDLGLGLGVEGVPELGAEMNMEREEGGGAKGVQLSLSSRVEVVD